MINERRVRLLCLFAWEHCIGLNVMLLDGCGGVGAGG